MDKTRELTIYKNYFGTIIYTKDAFNTKEKGLIIGFVMYTPKNDSLLVDFVATEKQLKRYDRKVDLEFYNLYIEGIKKDFDIKLMINPFLEHSDVLHSITYNYVNQFRFEIDEFPLMKGEVYSIRKTFREIQEMILKN